MQLIDHGTPGSWVVQYTLFTIFTLYTFYTHYIYYIHYPLIVSYLL